MRPVNLLRGEAVAARTRRRPRLAVLAAGATPLVAAAAVYAGWAAQHAKAADASARLDAVRAQVAAVAPSLAAVRADSVLATARAQRGSALAGILAKRQPWDATLTAIARVLPAGVWLDQVSVQSPNPLTAAATAAPAAGTGTPGLTVGGYALTEDEVASTLARLALVPEVSEPVLQSSASTVLGKRTVVQFEIAATLGGSGG